MNPLPGQETARCGNHNATEDCVLLQREPFGEIQINLRWESVEMEKLPAPRIRFVAIPEDRNVVPAEDQFCVVVHVLRCATNGPHFHRGAVNDLP
jgi:hypothetical protein